jgi:hypothetical protein
MPATAAQLTTARTRKEVCHLFFKTMPADSTNALPLHPQTVLTVEGKP